MGADALLMMLLTVPAGLYIVGACICRVAQLDPRSHRRAWGLFYVAWAAFAGGQVLDVLVKGALPGWPTLAALWGIWANLWLTHPTWKVRPPRVTEKPFDPKEPTS